MVLTGFLFYAYLEILHFCYLIFGKCFFLFLGLSKWSFKMVYKFLLSDGSNALEKVFCLFRLREGVSKKPGP